MMKHTLAKKLAIALTAAVLATPISMGAAPQTAEAGWGSLIHAAVSDTINMSKLTKEDDRINDT